MKNIDEAAKNLYSTLRKIKNDGFKKIARRKDTKQRSWQNN